MNIPFFSQKKPSGKTYLGIFLKEKEAVGLSITVKNGVMALDDYEKFNYSNGWDNICEDVDEMLIKLESKAKYHFKDTIFFVYSHFIDQKSKQVKKEYLTIIKTLVKSIELNALGYIEVYEAIAKFLEKKDGAPLTAILTEVDVSYCTVFIYKGGKVSFVKVLTRGANFVSDMENTFEELKGQILLPSRIVLYNSQHSNDLATELMTHRWTEDYFVQLPRVETINEDDLLNSLVNIFEAQVVGEKIQDSPNEELVSEEKEVMGFIVGEDVAETEAPDNIIVAPNQDSVYQKSKNWLSKVKVNVRFPVGIYIVIGLLIIGLALFTNEYFFHKARLKVFFPSQSLVKTIIIPDLTITVATDSAEFSEKKPTTGKHEIGEPARGEVTLYNLEDSTKSLKSGTTLTVLGHTYTLNETVEIPPATVDTATNASIPGKTKTKISAVTIGPESNLDKGKRFKIADLSVTIYYGINDAALTGGVKKSIQAVSKRDLDELKQRILTKAGKQKTTISKRESGERTIPELSDSILTDVKTTADIGEEAESVTLNATVVSKYYLYQEEKLKTLISKNLTPEIASGNALKKEDILYTFDKVVKKGGVINLTVSVKAKATKSVSKEEIIKKVIFKDKKAVEAILKQQYNAQGFELLNNQPIFIFGSILPIFSRNISIDISSL